MFSTISRKCYKLIHIKVNESTSIINWNYLENSDYYCLVFLLYLVIDIRFTPLSFPYLETIQSSFGVKVNRL